MGPGRALITGGARRIGRALALDLAAAGWDVAIHYNGSAEAAEATVAEIREAARRGVALRGDLLDPRAVPDLVPTAAETLGGPLTLLVNNASLFENDRVGSITAETWSRAMETNLHGPVLLTQAFAAQAPRAAVDPAGEPVAQAVVVNLIDQRVWKPTPFFQSYTLAKSALLSFTRTAAQALAPDIRVAAIGPGPTLRAERQSEAHFRRQRAACVLSRGSDPEDIAAALRFIIGCKAFTGQMLAIDGGQHLAWETPDVQGVDL
ncbi:MAG: SDR family oxidoreductase [Paracoccaceae bacterium]